MTLNKKAFKISGVTEKEYFQWCKENKKAAYLSSSKKEFFERIQNGKLIHDKEGNLQKKQRGKST